MCDRETLSLSSNIEPALVVGPDDDVAWLGTTPRGERLYAVVHRRGPVHTHLYRVAPCPVRRHGAVVHLETVLPGARLREARALAARLARANHGALMEAAE